MKKILIASIIILGFAGVAFAAPSTIFQRNILPEATNTYDLGSTTPANTWKNVFTQSLTITGLTSQNCIGTDSNGLVQIGTCGGGGGAGSDFSYVVAPYGRYLTPTSTVVGLLTPFTASSTLAKLTTVLSSSTQATTTYLKTTTLNVGTLDGFGFFTTGNVTASTSIGENYIAADIARDSELHNAVTLAGENYLTLSTQQITAGALGPTHLDALDFGDFTCNGTTCSLDTTYVPGTRTVTVAGTANQLTSSAGAQDLSANRTWTLSLPSHIIFPSSFQVSSASSTNATSTNLDITGLLTFNGVTGSTWTAFCTTITGSADLCDSNDATGGGGGAASDFTYTVAPYGRYLTPTSTAVGLLTFASSTLSNLTMVNSTTTNATTTNLTVTGTLDVDGLTSALTLTGAGGVFAEYTGTSCTNQFPRSLSALGAATCESVANADLTNSSFSTSLSGGILGSASVSLGGTLSLNVNIPSQLTYTVPPSTTVNSGLYLTPTSTAVGFLSSASSTLSKLTVVNSTSTNSTTTNLNITGQLDVDGLTSALVLTGAGGVFAEYTGTSCTNQFPRSLDALGAATCASVANADLTNSSVTVTAGNGLMGGGTVSLGSSVTLTANIPSELTYTIPAAGSVNGGRYLTPTSTAVGFLVGDTASSTFMRLTSRFSTTTEATTTYLNTTNLRINSQNFTSLLGSGLLNTAGVLTPDCATITGSADLCDGSDATGGGASFGTEFTYTVPPATGNSGLYLTPTSTSVGLLTFASSTMNKLSVNFGTTTQATSTSMYVSSILSVGSTSPYAALSIMGSGNIVAFGTTTGANATSTFSQRYVQGTGVITEVGDPFSTATSSFMKNGVNLVGGGCYAISGTCIGASASAGGSNTELQYNSGGSLAGLSGFTFAGSTLTMTSPLIVNNSSSTILNLLTVNATSTQATSTYLNVSTLASTSQMIVSNLLKIPYGGNPTIDETGKIAINTTAASSSLRFYDGTTERSLFGEIYPSTIYASSTLEYDGAFGAAGTTTYTIAHYPRPVTLMSIYCKTDVGTAYFEVGTGSASSTVQCTTSGAESTTDVSFIMRQAYMVSIGTSASAPNRITVTEQIQISAD